MQTLLRSTLLLTALTLTTTACMRIAPNAPGDDSTTNRQMIDHTSPKPSAASESPAAPAAMTHHENMWASVTQAAAVLYPTKGNSASGTLHFSELPNGGGVHIHGSITGLDPNSTHAFHIHEFGDASAPDGSSAGGHYNPEHHHHGGPNSPEHHAGDLGNITADASGSATIDITDPDLSIAGLKDPIIGRSVVLHAKPDDLVSQPVGNAGGRIAVGTIGIAK